MKPVRIILFAPGSKERVMAKALESGADAVLLDLEDSVPLAAKAQARSLVAQMINSVAAAGAARRAGHLRAHERCGECWSWQNSIVRER